MNSEIKNSIKHDDMNGLKENQLYKTIKKENDKIISNLSIIGDFIRYCCHINSFDCLNRIIYDFNIVNLILKLSDKEIEDTILNEPLLLYCCCWNSYDCFKLLIDYGFDVNKIYKYKYICKHKNDYQNYQSCIEYTCQYNMKKYTDYLLINNTDYTLISKKDNNTIIKNLIYSLILIEPNLNVLKFDGGFYPVRGWLTNFKDEYNLKIELIKQHPELLSEINNFRLVSKDNEEDIVDILTIEMKHKLLWTKSEDKCVILEWL